MVFLGGHPAKYQPPTIMCASECVCVRLTALSDIYLTFNDISISNHDLPDVINNVLINITSAIPVIDTIKLGEIRRSCGPLPNELIIEEHDVFIALNRLKLKKAIGPDCIPNKIVKHFSYIHLLLQFVR